MQEPSVAPNCCSNCRHAHKKCDRLLPQCSLCLKTNRTCTYASVGKRGPKKGSKRHQPYPVINTPTEPVNTIKPPSEINYMNDEAVKFKAALELPFIPREEINSVIAYLHKEIHGISHSLPAPNEDVLAVVCAMQAAILKMMGKDEPAKFMYTKARGLLATKFEDMLDNFSTASGYAYMASYCALNGEVERARFFLSNVRTFLNIWQHAGNKHPNIYFLQNLYDDGVLFLSGDADVEGHLKHIVLNHIRVREYYQGDDDIDPAVWAVINTTNSFKKALNSNDVRLQASQYDLNVDQVVQLGDIFSEMFDRLLIAGMNPNFVSTKRVHMLMLLYGIKLYKLMQQGKLHEAKVAADTISRMTSLPFYTLIVPAVAHVVSAAANVHLHFMKNTTDVLKQGELVNRMRDDLVTLNLVCSRNRLLAPRCGTVMLHLSEALRSFEQGVMVYRNEAYFSTPARELYDIQVPAVTEETAAETDMPADFPPTNELVQLNEVPFFQEELIELDIDNFFVDFVENT
jgi:hypothetical protein